MTTFSKVLAVAVAAASVAFLGFVMVLLAGGPNWRGEMAELETQRYDFSLSEGETPLWSVKRAGQTIGSSPVPPKAIVAARKEWLQRQTAEEQKLTEEKEALDARLTFVRPLIKADQQAFVNRRETLVAAVDVLETQVRDLAVAVQATAEKGLETQETVEARWQEGYRVVEQVAETKTDAGRLDDEKQLLQARLVILQGNIDRLERIVASLDDRLPNVAAAADETPDAAAPVDPAPGGTTNDDPAGE